MRDGLQIGPVCLDFHKVKHLGGIIMPDGCNTSPCRSIVVSEFTNSFLDPNVAMLGPVENGGTIIANTALGCWGQMITPSLRGGHEVTRPVFVEGAEIGDGVAIRIRDITVPSIATASGHDSSPAGFCLGDPYVPRVALSVIPFGPKPMWKASGRRR